MRTAPMVSDAGQMLHREFVYTSTWARRAMHHQRWSWWYRLHSKLRYAIAIIIFIPNKLVQLCREQSLPVGVNLLGKFKLVSAGAASSLKKFATLGRGLALRMTTVVRMICLWWRWFVCGEDEDGNAVILFLMGVVVGLLAMLMDWWIHSSY